MQTVLHNIEKKIISSLVRAGSSGVSEKNLAESSGLGIDQVRRGTEWLRHKGLVDVTEKTSRTLLLGENGRTAHLRGLPERRLLEMLKDGPQEIATIAPKLGEDFGPAVGIARKNGWVGSDGTSLTLLRMPKSIGGETLIRRIAEHAPLNLDEIVDTESLASLMRRPGFVFETATKSRNISLTDKGRSLDLGAAGGIDVVADAPAVYPARTHPLKDVIGEIREAFVTLGFSEVDGTLCQSGFWNFDALFTPQDHPAREMQDTFYLDAPPYDHVAPRHQLGAVSAEHSRHWRGGLSLAESHRTVLRTHTTCVTIRHIAETRPESARVFSLGRVFRNEKQSYKHLAEFNQVEGVVIGRNVTLRGLMGIQTEFYRRMGMHKVKFWPTFFPYTEPSLQSMVYNDALGRWIELFGMGIFRSEVTAPLGIKSRVLAWGGGIERIAMLRYGISDVRELYANRLAWLRGTA